MASTKITVTLDPAEYALLKDQLGRDMDYLQETYQRTEVPAERKLAGIRLAKLRELDKSI